MYRSTYVKKSYMMTTSLDAIDEDLRNDFERIKYSILILIDKAASKGHTFIIFKNRSQAKAMADHLMPGFWDELKSIEWVKFREMDSDRRWPIMELNRLKFTDGFIAVHAVSEYWERCIHNIHNLCRGLGKRISDKDLHEEAIQVKLVRGRENENPEQINNNLLYYEANTLGTKLWPFE